MFLFPKSINFKFFGWWIAFTGFFQLVWVSGTIFFGMSAFIDPIADQYGWSRAAMAGAISLQRTESGIVGPFVGPLIDRFGARLPIFFGTILTTIGFFWLARTDGSIVNFYFAFGTIALGVSIGSVITTTTVIGNWFIRYRSTALTIGFLGTGLGGFLIPLLVWGIKVYGWSNILDIIAVVNLFVGLIVLAFMRHKPEQYGEYPDGINPEATNSGLQRQNTTEEISLSTKEILKQKSFWLINLSFGITGIALSTVMVFAIPNLSSIGFDPIIGAYVLTATSVLLFIGRLIIGFLADTFNKRYLLCLTFALIGFGTLLFGLITEPWHIIIFVILYGVGHGGTVPVRFAYLADMYGRKSYGTVIGITTTTGAIFGIIGPIYAGYIYDQNMDYRIAFTLIGILTFISIPLILMVKETKQVDEI
ncbi:MAG: MFS transporter [Dehalococcoidia bacterium]